MPEVLVIGGSNIDFFGKTKNSLKLRDSNIGEITIAFGGVARNITENLSRLGMNVTFVTVIGATYFDEAMKKELIDLNVKLIIPNGNYKTSNYLAIHDNNGDMMVALCDQHLNEALNIEYLKTLKSVFEKFKYVVIDTNLEEATLGYIISICKDKIIFADAISTTKVSRLRNYLPKINYLKCNLEEAKILYNMEEEKIIDFLKNNYEDNHVIISDGSSDILFNENKMILRQSVDEVDDDEIINLTGAGDALLSGIIFGIVNNFSLREAIILGTKISSATIKSQGATAKENLKKYL